MHTSKDSLLAKTIICYLNSPNSQTGTLYNLPNPHQSNDWCDVTKRAQHLVVIQSVQPVPNSMSLLLLVDVVVFWNIGVDWYCVWP